MFTMITRYLVKNQRFWNGDGAICNMTICTKLHNNPTNRCPGISPRTTNIHLMVVLQEKSEDRKNNADALRSIKQMELFLMDRWKRISLTCNTKGNIRKWPHTERTMLMIVLPGTCSTTSYTCPCITSMRLFKGFTRISFSPKTS